MGNVVPAIVVLTCVHIHTRKHRRAHDVHCNRNGWIGVDQFNSTSNQFRSVLELRTYFTSKICLAFFHNFPLLFSNICKFHHIIFFEYTSIRTQWYIGNGNTFVVTFLNYISLSLCMQQFSVVFMTTSSSSTTKKYLSFRYIYWFACMYRFI